jgi:exo-beta-1,3-glucanase (GH17 family)
MAYVEFADYDFRLVTAQPFWQGTAIDNATHTYFDDITQAFQQITTISGSSSIEMWAGATGWPTSMSFALRYSPIREFYHSFI